jgi:hypothetical protein
VEIHVLVSDYVNMSIICSVNLPLQKRESCRGQFYHREQTEGASYRSLPLDISQGGNPCASVFLRGLSFRSSAAVCADSFEIVVSCERVWGIFENTVQTCCQLHPVSLQWAFIILHSPPPTFLPVTTMVLVILVFFAWISVRNYNIQKFMPHSSHSLLTQLHFT